MRDIVERLYDRAVCSPPQNSCRNDWLCDQAAAEITRLRADLAAAERERDEAHNWSETVERHGTDDFDALAEQWTSKDFVQRLIRAGSSVFAKWANDELTKRHHQLVSDIAHQAFVEGALCGVRAEMAKGAADLAAAQEREQRMREALEWYGEQARLCRIVHKEGDAGRHALNNDGGKRARAALGEPQ